jgi:AraC-like DNA-binding protein
MSSKPSSRSSLAPIATVLLPDERQRVDDAGEGLYQALHRNTIEEVVRDLREQRVRAVLLSVNCCEAVEASRLARLVREFPRVPAVAILSQVEPATAQAVLSLGQSGVRSLVDVRQPGGWRELREVLVANRSEEIERLALGQLSLDLMGAPDDCWRFFEILFRTSLRVTTVRALAGHLGILPSTLMSRFFRAHLPPPKQYLAAARLIRAARLFENPGLSVANVSNYLDYSSPQSFSRHIRVLLNMSAMEFRQRYDGEGMLQRFREELVLPYRDALRRFNPVAAPPRWITTRVEASGDQSVPREEQGAESARSD